MIIRRNTYILLNGYNSKEIFIVGRSNAINIAERLGLPSVVVDTARRLYGSASAEIDEVFLIHHNCIYYLLMVVYVALLTSVLFMLFCFRLQVINRPLFALNLML